MDVTASSILEDLEPQAQFVPPTLRDWWVNCLRTHTSHYVSVLSRLPAPKKSGRILEVGAIPGHLTILLKHHGYEVCSVDLAPDRLADLWSHHSIEMRRVDIEQEPLPFDSNTFDCILFTEVLEHLRIQPIFALQEMARVLAPRGRIVLSIPNITPLDRIKFLFGEDYQGDIIAEFAKLDSVGHMGHIRLYSMNEVQRILQHVGLVDISCQREGRRVGRWLWRFLFPWKDAFREHLYFEASKSTNSAHLE